MLLCVLFVLRCVFAVLPHLQTFAMQSAFVATFNQDSAGPTLYPRASGAALGSSLLTTAGQGRVTPATVAGFTAAAAEHPDLVDL